MKYRKMSRRIATILIISVLLVLTLVLLFIINYYLGGGGISSPEYNLQAIILVFLTVIDILLILIFILILSRYLIKTFFEKRDQRFFSSIKIKLTLSLMALSTLPIAIFMFLSYEVINESVNQWFSTPAEEILHHSEELARAYYSSVVENTRRMMGDFINNSGYSILSPGALTRYRKKNALDAVLILDGKGRILFQDDASSERQHSFVLENPSLVVQNAQQNSISYYVENHPDADIVICFVKNPQTEDKILLFVKRIEGSIAYRAFLITEAYQEYFQLKNQVELIRLNYFIVVGVAGIIMLFGFVWFSIYISKKITIPVQALLDGSRRIAGGDFSEPLICSNTRDEFDELIHSFNKMTEDLRCNKEVIEEANINLKRFNEELETRNTFINSVLNTVAAGVVSLNQDLVITISNSAVKHLLKQRHIQINVTHLKEVVPQEKYDELLKLLKETEFHQRVSREIVFRTGKREMHFVVTATLMTDIEGKNAGYVIIFDDVSDLIKTEKAAAWQEVARRLAHEIKNPLTPIQLSVERIRKQFQRLKDGGILMPTRDLEQYERILDESLATAQSETRTLKYLVEEFSRFARLPVPILRTVNVNRLVEEVARRYQRPQCEAEVVIRLEENLPEIYADSELINRVLVNLIDNACESALEVPDAGNVCVKTHFDRHSHRVLVEVEDNGKGISEEIWDQLFLPYFSTKENGMGLGLTFVKKILDDHDAGIRVENIIPRGCRFIVEFRKMKLAENETDTV